MEDTGNGKPLVIKAILVFMMPAKIPLPTFGM